jgi:hypothetical protein
VQFGVLILTVKEVLDLGTFTGQLDSVHLSRTVLLRLNLRPCEGVGVDKNLGEMKLDPPRNGTWGQARW